MKPTPPCVRALDADGSEFFVDSRGLAWRADSSRAPELDGPPSSAPLDRAEVAKALAEEASTVDRYGAFLKTLGERRALADRKAALRAIERIVDALGLRAEFDAACREVERG